MIDLTPDGPQLTPMHKVPYFKRSCANLSKQRIPPHETDFVPDELFADDDNNRKDILGGELFLFATISEVRWFKISNLNHGNFS